MDDLIKYLSAHPVILVIAIAVALLLIYFLFREMLKVLLITSLVVIVLGLIALYGYYHYGTSDRLPRNVRETVDRVGDQRERMSDVGRAVVEKSRELVEKVGESMRERHAREEE
ncbi:MAG: hypothetical protein JXI32_09405 [Deltaproteobacteria bacterium]|nr:hypothetical protein [Deltaproteobacteria bacterium]